MDRKGLQKCEEGKEMYVVIVQKTWSKSCWEYGKGGTVKMLK